MTDEQTSDIPVDETSETSSDAWHDVISQLDALGDAMGRWARAATSDPENRERAHELKQHMEQMAETVGGAVDDVVSNDVGQGFRDAANKTGSAFRAASDRVAEEVSPRVAAAFRATAEKLHQASERMESKATEEGSDATADHAPEPDAADEADAGSSEV